MKVSTMGGNKLVKAINSYKMGKLFAYNLKETIKHLEEKDNE